MKKLASIMVIGIVLTLSMAGSARAQLPGTVIRVAIPFDFMIRGKVLPAGRYEVSRISEEPSGLMIRNVDHRRDETMFQTEPANVTMTTKKDELVFHHYGDSYFLSEVITAGEQTGEELTPSRAEREMRRDTARNQVEPETITVAALN